MSIKENLKQEAASERSKLASMSTKDKIWYIWEYYKFHIFGVILLVAAIITVGGILHNRSIKTQMFCVILNNKNMECNTEEYLEQGYGEYIGVGKKDKIVIDSSMYVTYDDTITEFGYASLAKLTALMSNKDLDVMIADPASIDHFAEIGGFANLEEVLPADLTELLKDDFYYTKDENGNSYPYAVSLDNSNFTAETGVHCDPTLLGIVSNSTRTDRGIELIRYIFEQ